MADLIASVIAEEEKQRREECGERLVKTHIQSTIHKIRMTGDKNL